MKWHDIPSASTLKKLIQQQLALILPSVHGYSLVTIGELATNFDYQAAAVANIIRINCDDQRGDVCALPHQLPLASDDIDAIFIPLLIEESDSHHQLLREAARSLRPGGKLIIVMFNPVSFWGVYKLLFWTSKRKPWCYPFYRLGRLTDWMSLLGLEITVEHGLFPKLPGSEYHSDKNTIGSIGYSRFGAIKILVAEKRIKTLTAIRPNWKKLKAVNTQFIEPTRKNIE